MDDEIVDLEVAKVGDERMGGRASPFVHPALFFEEIGLGEDQEPRVDQVEASRERAGRDKDGGELQIVLRHRAGTDFVVAEQLDYALRAAGGIGDEDDAIAAISCLLDLLDPVTDPAVIFERRQAGDMACVGLWLVDSELRDLMRRSQPLVQVGPRRGERFVGGHLPAARLHVACRAAPLLLELSAQIRDVIALEHHDGGTGGARVVDDGGGSIDRFAVGAGGFDQLALRADDDPIDRGERALGRGIIAADRLDDVADELEPDRLRVGGRIEIDDTAAHAKLPVLVNGIFGRESGSSEPHTQILRRDFATRCERDPRIPHQRRSGHARHERSRRRDDHPRGSACQRMKRPGAGGCDLEVRREATVRIDLVRGKRQDDVFDIGPRETLKTRQEKPHVAAHLLDRRVGRHDEEDGVLWREGGGMERGPGRREAIQSGRGTAKAGLERGRFQQRPKSE